MLCMCRGDTGERAALLQLFNKYAAPAIAFTLGEGDPGQARAPLKQALPATSLNMVQQLCELLAVLLQNSGRVQDPQVQPCTHLSSADVMRSVAQQCVEKCT